MIIRMTVCAGLTEPVDVYCDWIDMCEAANADEVEDDKDE